MPSCNCLFTVGEATFVRARSAGSWIPGAFLLLLSCASSGQNEQQSLPTNPAAGGNAAGSSSTAVGAGAGGQNSRGGSNSATGAASSVGGKGGSQTTVDNPSRIRVIGYEESWSANEVSTIQFGKLTHINYAFALPNPNGTFQTVPNESKLDKIVAAAHAAGVTVSISFGGWNNGDDSAFHALARSASTRTTFADAVTAYVQAHDLDGADIDWEYPEQETASDYTALLGSLNARLRPAGKLLTAAVGAGAWISAGITADSYQYLDYLMIMAYDDSSSPNHSTYAFAESALNLWLNDKAAPASKLVLGVPFYSSPGYMAYADIVAQSPAAAQQDQSNGQYYNGIPTIRAKTQLAMSKASGIMIWELSQDTNDSLSLLNAIDEVVNP